MRPRIFFRRSSSVAHGKIRTAGPTLAQDSMSHLCSKRHQECGSLPHLAGGVFCGDASCCPRRSSLWMSQTALIRLFWSLLQNWMDLLNGHDLHDLQPYVAKEVLSNSSYFAPPARANSRYLWNNIHCAVRSVLFSLHRIESQWLEGSVMSMNDTIRR